MSPSEGRVVATRFRVAGLLGTGGSASVYAATDLRTGGDVALKVLHPHLAERPAAREAFLAEARRAQLLQHPNIVGVLDAGSDESGDAPTVWIAFERAPGRTLAEHVARDGALGPQGAVVVADSVLRALQAAHSGGLVHRDLSPSNVMMAVDESGLPSSDGVRLLDFGLADAIGSTVLGTDDLLGVEATGRAGVMGNVNYMAPEQVRGEPVDERGDIYQLGGVLYFALTGHPPFSRESAAQTMRAHLTAPPPRPSVSDSRIPRGLDRVVVRAMLKDPEDRFASAAIMRAALLAVDLGAPSAAPPPPGVEATDAAPRGLADMVVPVPGEAVHVSPSSTVTRVLGRTMVPPRATGGSSASTRVTPANARRARSGAGAWLGIAASIVAVAGIILLSSTSAPTASLPRPSASAPPAAEPSPAPTPVPTPAPSQLRATEPPAAFITVPDLVGRTFSEADALLVEWGLLRGEVTVVDSPSPRDLVLESRPAPGSRVDAGGVVVLVVASGRNAVPDVAGQPRETAEALLRSAGFTPIVVDRESPPGSASGVSLGTSPGAGVSLTLGDAVTIFRSAPRVPTPTVTATPGPTPSPSPTQ